MFIPPALLLWGSSLLLRADRAAPHPTGYVGRRLSSVAVRPHNKAPDRGSHPRRHHHRVHTMPSSSRLPQGPFRTVVERFERCPSSEGGEVDEDGEAVVVNVTRLSRQWGPRPQAQRITGNVTLRLPLDDATAVSAPRERPALRYRRP